jgi:UDP-N-acetylglucosamine 4,6-dehydratase
LNKATIHAFKEPSFDLNGKTILITGGTGSFGRAFFKQILTTSKPKKVIIFSRDEFKQHEMSLSFPRSEYPNVRYFIGDVRDAERLKMAMRGVDYVVHAAALKQVEAAEYNPFECIRTNVFGAENVIRAAIANKVEKVIALSTDKAANPVNLYGASKLASDKIFIAGNYLSGASGTRFSVVRYGNVVGSRGSVVEVFRRMIEDGCTSIPITDPMMTRFWITLSQATQFVLSSFDMMAGGEIFVPKIPSIKVTELAEAMAPSVPINLIGIRPGEKLDETMITIEDNRTTSELRDRYIIESSLDLSILSVKERFGDQVKELKNDFAYTSNDNEDWMNADEIRTSLHELGMMPKT